MLGSSVKVHVSRDNFLTTYLVNHEACVFSQVERDMKRVCSKREREGKKTITRDYKHAWVPGLRRRVKHVWPNSYLLSLLGNSKQTKKRDKS